jgi:SsrA-binding protein
VPDILQNAKARHQYEVLETVEAGLVLRGTEVKSLRAGRGQITEAFARIEKGQAWLYGAHIDEYSHGNVYNHIPKTPRRLLLNKSEIRRLEGFSNIKGHALVPLAFYWKGNRVKVRLAVGRGKDFGDKREDLKKREADREVQRVLSRLRKGR